MFYFFSTGLLIVMTEIYDEMIIIYRRTGTEARF